MLTALLFAAVVTSSDCHWISGACLVEGTNNTWTKGGAVWAGNPYCAGSVDAPEPVFLLQPDSPAIDAGALIEGHHCPLPGSSVGQPKMTDWLGDNCREWYGAAPDIGACEFVPVQQVDLQVPEIEVIVEDT